MLFSEVMPNKSKKKKKTKTKVVVSKE